MRINSIERLSATSRVRKAALAQLHKRSFSGGYSYPSGGSPLQGLYRTIRRDIATREIFALLESAGLVRLEARPDDSAQLDDLKGDTFNRTANPDIPESRMAKEEAEFEARINREGVYGIVGEYRVSDSEQWESADSVWGFIGDDWQGSGYDTDIMASTIAAYHAARKAVCPHCGRPRNAKRAHKH